MADADAAGREQKIVYLKRPRSPVDAQPAIAIDTVADLLANVAQLYNQPGLHVLFLPKIEVHFNQQNCPRLVDDLSKALYLPKWYFDRIGWDLNGFFGSKTYEEKSNSTYSTFSRFLSKRVYFSKNKTRLAEDPDPKDPDAIKDLAIDYDWSYMAFSTIWRLPKNKVKGTSATAPTSASVNSNDNDPNVSVILACFDLSEKAQSFVRDALHMNDPNLEMDISNPFHVLTRISWAVVREFDEAVWMFQPKVRFVEKARLQVGNDKGVDMATLDSKYDFIHDLSRHALHITETLEVAVRNLASILKDYSDFESEHQSETIDKSSKQWDDQITRDLRLTASMMENIQQRASIFVDRLGNEAQVAFNIAALNASDRNQREGRELGNTVAVLTLFFLPGTFVSGFFGMNFFTLGDSGWRWNNRFWYFWAITIPLTFIGIILFTLELNFLPWTRAHITVPLKNSLRRSPQDPERKKKKIKKKKAADVEAERGMIDPVKTL